MKNHLLEKLHPNLIGGTPLNIFKILKNLTKKSYGAFKIWRGKKIQKISNLLVGNLLVTEKNIVSNFIFGKNVVKSGQSVVKLWSNNGQTNYSRILVLLNNYFSYFEFWSNLVKLWSNCGQTNYSRNISVTK